MKEEKGNLLDTTTKETSADHNLLYGDKTNKEKQNEDTQYKKKILNE